MKTKQSLASKLCAIMRAVDSIAELGENDSAGYTYARESEVKKAFRGELAKRKVFLAPKCLESRRVAVQLPTRVGPIDTWVTELRVEWTFYDGDSSATITCVVDGAGEDQSDKGVYKALTGSLKALLRSAFLVPGADDPDSNSKTLGKETREKKVEAAQKVAKEIIDGTHPSTAPPLPLWYIQSEGGFEIQVKGPDATLNDKTVRETLMFRGRYVPKSKCYVVPSANLDGLQFVLKQLGVGLKELGENGDH